MSLATLLQTNEIPLARDNGPLTVLSVEQTANATQHVAPVEGSYGLGINNFWTNMLGSSSSTAQPHVTSFEQQIRPCMHTDPHLDY